MYRIFTNSVLTFIAGGLFFFGIMATSTSISDKHVEKTTASVSVDPLLGEIMITGTNFCPRGWASCEGQLLPVAQNTALFSLLGTTYGGDGRTTFALPDMRGRAPIGVGTGTGLSPVKQGQKVGTESVSSVKPNQNTFSNNPSLGLTYCICMQGTYPSRN